MKKNKKLIGGLVVVILIAVAVWYFYFRSPKKEGDLESDVCQEGYEGTPPNCTIIQSDPTNSSIPDEKQVTGWVTTYFPAVLSLEIITPSGTKYPSGYAMTINQEGVINGIRVVKSEKGEVFWGKDVRLP